MSRICFFIGDINCSGGTERVCSVIANALIAEGHTIHILSLQRGDKPFFELSSSIIFSQLFTTQGRGLTRFPLVVLGLHKYLRKNEIDILIDVESMLALYALPATIGLDIRHICWEHFNYNVDLGKVTRRLARKLAARFADDIVTLTERDRELWLINTKCSANITAIPNPVTIELPESVNSHRERLFLAVGRLTYQKGFDLLLQAWSEVAYLNPEWKLRIIGDGEDKPKLEQLRVELGIQESTEILPTTNNIAEHYREAAYFVMSSRFEGLPLVLIEAQAFGLPVISFDCDTGPAEIVKSAGWLVKNGCVTSFSTACISAIEYFNNGSYENLVYKAVDSSKNYNLSAIVATWSAFLSRQN